MQQQAGPGFWFACLPVPVLIKKKNLAMGRTIDRSRVRMINHETHGRVEKGTKTGLPYETCRNIASQLSHNSLYAKVTCFGDEIRAVPRWTIPLSKPGVPLSSCQPQAAAPAGAAAAVDRGSTYILIESFTNTPDFAAAAAAAAAVRLYWRGCFHRKVCPYQYHRGHHII